MKLHSKIARLEKKIVNFAQWFSIPAGERGNRGYFTWIQLVPVFVVASSNSNIYFILFGFLLYIKYIFLFNACLLLPKVVDVFLRTLKSLDEEVVERNADRFLFFRECFHLLLRNHVRWSYVSAEEDAQRTSRIVNPMIAHLDSPTPFSSFFLSLYLRSPPLG